MAGPLARRYWRGAGWDFLGEGRLQWISNDLESVGVDGVYSCNAILSAIREVRMIRRKREYENRHERGGRSRLCTLHSQGLGHVNGTGGRSLL